MLQSAGHVVPVGLRCNWNGRPGGPGPGNGPRAHGPGARAQGPRSGHGARGPDPCEMVNACDIFRSIPSTIKGLYRPSFRLLHETLVSWPLPDALGAVALAGQLVPRSILNSKVMDHHDEIVPGPNAPAEELRHSHGPMPAMVAEQQDRHIPPRFRLPRERLRVEVPEPAPDPTLIDQMKEVVAVLARASTQLR